MPSTNDKASSPFCAIEACSGAKIIGLGYCERHADIDESEASRFAALIGDLDSASCDYGREVGAQEDESAEREARGIRDEAHEALTESIRDLLREVAALQREVRK
jgi:hypothetical protein